MEKERVLSPLLQALQSLGIFPFEALEDVCHAVNMLHLRHHLSDFHLAVLDVALEDGPCCRLLAENLS